MSLLEFLRHFRLGGYAIFDFIVAFLGIYLITPLLTKPFLRGHVIIPLISWLFFVIPISILVHMVFNQRTPLTAQFFDFHGHYLLKIFVFSLFFLGMATITFKKKKVVRK